MWFRRSCFLILFLLSVFLAKSQYVVLESKKAAILEGRKIRKNDKLSKKSWVVVKPAGTLKLDIESPQHLRLGPRYSQRRFARRTVKQVV